MTAVEPICHEEAWLLLPWLANGRLSALERDRMQEHVRLCPRCELELALQHRMCRAFTEPDRVSYAPGPSFRKLMTRIDAESVAGGRSSLPAQRARPALRTGGLRLGSVSLWRPPGLAWAASFLVLFGITGLLTTAYRWSEPLYRTHTEAGAPASAVLHIALDRSLTIREAQDLLRTSGARVVEGSADTGVFGVMPAAVSDQTPPRVASRELQALSARLRANPRVLWVQPLADNEASANQRVPAAQGR